MVRVVAREKPTSTGSSRPFSARWDARRTACARSASGVRPDNGHGTVPPAIRAPSAVPGSGSVAAEVFPGVGSVADTTRWQLVPPTPNDDTPARARPSR
ncbi:hypothetical protein GCM10009574_084800 [Streptomyces asiaticus]|uniref:Uncharacterized protein n=1 Tax=Streptomyces rhizosphaericus TaxID=114699 RepID=A0ABN1SI80_9ACTN